MDQLELNEDQEVDYFAQREQMEEDYPVYREDTESRGNTTESVGSEQPEVQPIQQPEVKQQIPPSKTEKEEQQPLPPPQKQQQQQPPQQQQLLPLPRAPQPQQLLRVSQQLPRAPLPQQLPGAPPRVMQRRVQGPPKQLSPFWVKMLKLRPQERLTEVSKIQQQRQKAMNNQNEKEKQQPKEKPVFKPIPVPQIDPSIHPEPELQSIWTQIAQLQKMVDVSSKEQLQLKTLQIFEETEQYFCKFL